MKKLPLFVENLVKRILRVPAFFIFAGTAQAEFVDLIALNSVPEDETAANVGIISLNNPNLAPPAGFENGFQTARENGRQIRYHIMDGNPDAWSAVVGNGIEYWQDNSGGALGVELCAGPRSRGVKQRFAMEANKDFCGGYALVWNHYGRVPKSGTLDYSYTVMITAGDPSAEGAQTIGTPLVIESARVPAGGTATECFFFGIGETDLPAIEKNGLWISITPNTTGTFSAVVSNLRIVKICMAVDKNRDRNVSFGGDDFTSASEPYRFWINNDSDKSGMGEDEVSAIDQSGSAEPDSNNEKPESIRDLEDFSRLQIRFFGDENAMAWIFEKLKSGDLSAQIRSSGSAKIRVWRHLDDAGTLSYIDGGQAQEITGLQTIRVAHGTTPELLFQTKIWKDWSPGNPKYAVRGISVEHPRLNLLFEGVDQGKSQFFAEFSFADRDYQATASVWLELLDVRKMFEQVQLVGTNSSGSEKYSWSSDQFGSFRKPWDEEAGKQIAFIHGWNMEKAGTRSYAETAFKRLWWQNYKGRFSSVYWPTETGGTTYCPSEFIAWKCGEALSDYFDVLKNNGMTVNVMAHSMGNIVVGSALKEGATIGNYALLNAAIPMECYDEDENLRQPPQTKTLTSSELMVVNLGPTYLAWAKPSVSDDPIRELASRGYRGYLKNVSGSLTNFYLPKDFATEEAWEFNNSTQKPWGDIVNKIFSGSYVYYSYDTKIGISKKMRMRIVAGELIEETDSILVEDVIDPEEVMSYVDSSKTKVAGTEGRSYGKFLQNINMGEIGEIGVNFNREHSAQFVLPIQRTWKFWNTLKEILEKSK